jgi:DNA-binding NarL/FixJ family response regulator
VKLKLLIVDDHPIARQTLHAMLDAQSGLRVIGCAQDGQEAIPRAFELWPDVILMDLNMPQMSGLDTTRQLRELGFNRRITIISADLDNGLGLACRLSGADAYVSKNDALENILAAITGDTPMAMSGA